MKVVFRKTTKTIISRNELSVFVVFVAPTRRLLKLLRVMLPQSGTFVNICMRVHVLVYGKFTMTTQPEY